MLRLGRYTLMALGAWFALVMGFLVLCAKPASADPPPTTADVTLEVQIDPPAGVEVCFTRELNLPVPDKETFCLGDGDTESFYNLAPGGSIIFEPSNNNAVWTVSDLGCKPGLGVGVSGGTITVPLAATDTTIECWFDVTFNAQPTATPRPATATPVPTATLAPATPAPIVIVVTAVPEPTAVPTLAPIGNPFTVTPPNTGDAGLR